MTWSPSVSVSVASSSTDTTPANCCGSADANVSVALPDRLTGPDSQVIGALDEVAEGDVAASVGQGGQRERLRRGRDIGDLRRSRCPARLSCTASEAVALVVIGIASPVSGSR